MTGAMPAGWRWSHHSRTVSGVVPLRAASLPSSSPAGPASARVKRPWARAPQAWSRIPLAEQYSTVPCGKPFAAAAAVLTSTPASTQSRRARLISSWLTTSGTSSCAWSCAICAALMLETPKCRTRPCRWSAVSAAAISSGRASGSGRCSSSTSRESVRSRTRLSSTRWRMLGPRRSYRPGRPPSGSRMPHLLCRVMRSRRPGVLARTSPNTASDLPYR